ncbi:NAD(P)-binding protein [Apiospora sp. TS-2023a]
MARVMIYGASGYTGRLASEQAKTLNLPLILAGRSEAAVAHVATSLDVPYRVFDLDEPKIVASALRDEDLKVLLNCAGPFALTAQPLIATCIETGVHYLDISAELGSYQLAFDLSDAAKKANVMLLPGCGGSVAMLGCLAAHALRNIRSPTQIDIALRVAGPMSRGSIASAAGSVMAGDRCLQRRDGKLVPWSEQEGEDEAGAGDNVCQQFDFGDGEGLVACFPLTLPDLITIGKSTGVANIRTFACVGGSGTMSFPEDDETIPDGPTAEERETSPYHAAVTITDAHGGMGRAVLHTVNGYTFTAMASVEAVRRVLDGEVKVGFQTPATFFGKDFVETIAGSRLVDICTRGKLD